MSHEAKVAYAIKLRREREAAKCGVKLTVAKHRIGCILPKGHDGPHQWIKKES